MPIRLGYLLIDGFALMSYAPVIEPFRAANRLSGQNLYSWRHYSATGAEVRASTGVCLSVDGPITALDAPDVLFVCAGGNPALFADPATFDALRRAARFGVRMAGISGGPFILARAGLLDGYRCTIHWEHEIAFAETFPAADLERGLFVIDRNNITCAGGLAGLDLATALIGDDQGIALSREVSDWYIQTEHRQADDRQRRTPAQRYLVTHRGLAQVLAVMEGTPSEPIDRHALAHIAGISIRQLERLFLSKLGTTIGAHSRGLRLAFAQKLLTETDVSITEAAVASGFSSVSYFSKQFKLRSAISPSNFRRSLGVKQIQLK